MRTLIYLILALALAACASNTPPPAAALDGATRASDLNGPGVFAALASSGTYEMVVAPAYTRLAMQRRAAARALEAGRIEVGAARRIQALADQARRHLDIAWADKQPTQAAAAALDSARHLQTRIDQILGAQP